MDLFIHASKYILQAKIMKRISTEEDKDIKRKDEDEELAQDWKKGKEEEYKEPLQYMYTDVIFFGRVNI